MRRVDRLFLPRVSLKCYERPLNVRRLLLYVDAGVWVLTEFIPPGNRFGWASSSPWIHHPIRCPSGIERVKKPAEGRIQLPGGK